MKKISHFLLYILVVGLFVGCWDNSKRPGEKKYIFQTQNMEKIQIYTNFDFFEAKMNNKLLDSKNTLVFFFDLDSVACLEYMEVLKNLQANYGDLRVLAFLNKTSNQQNLEELIKKFEINFLILNPLENKNILRDFAAKIYPNQNSEKKQQDLRVPNLPFLILYDRNGKKFEQYEGAVPQEMFMHDLSKI